MFHLRLPALYPLFYLKRRANRTDRIATEGHLYQQKLCNLGFRVVRRNSRIVRSMYIFLDSRFPRRVTYLYHSVIGPLIQLVRNPIEQWKALFRSRILARALGHRQIMTNLSRLVLKQILETIRSMIAHFIYLAIFKHVNF